MHFFNEKVPVFKNYSFGIILTIVIYVCTGFVPPCPQLCSGTQKEKGSTILKPVRRYKDSSHVMDESRDCTQKKVISTLFHCETTD